MSMNVILSERIVSIFRCRASHCTISHTSVAAAAALKSYVQKFSIQYQNIKAGEKWNAQGNKECMSNILHVAGLYPYRNATFYQCQAASATLPINIISFVNIIPELFSSYMIKIHRNERQVSSVKVSLYSTLS